MKNYSISIFGSTLRKDFDKYSDRDLLAVAEDYKTLKKIKTKYSNDNWSISYYTYSKLEYLSKNGSLFIKHLQKESKILVDSNDKLSNILSEYKPKTSYEKDVNDSMNYFEILQIVPNTLFGYAWFCDCLYVGLRNYLVFKNAESGIFEFSFIKLLNTLKEQNILNDMDVSILKELRVVKRNYRENINDELPSLDYLNNVIPIISKIGILKSIEFLDLTRFKNYVEKNILNEHFDAYQRLRLAEGLYSSHEIDIPELKKIICNPQFYASKMKDNEFTMDLISQISKRHTTTPKRNTLLDTTHSQNVGPTKKE